MRFTAAVPLLLFQGMLLEAQAPSRPVLNPRGVINAFTQQPAPSSVAPGGIIDIQGLNLGPAQGAKAEGLPLPTQLGEPPVEVLINGQPAPLFSASPERIVAQAPWDAAIGLASVVVRRGGDESPPARIMINRLEPSVRTAEDRGFGEAAAALSGRMLTLAGTGLGPTQPRVNSGEAGPQDTPARPRERIQAYIGGLPARVNARLSTERPGEFEIRVEAPPAAQAGDVITLLAGNRAANRTTFQRLSSPEVHFLPLPEGAPELRSLVGADLRGVYMIAGGARDSDGCYPSYLFDFSKQQAGRIDACLTAGNRSARSPVVAAPDGSALAALVGPPQGEPPAGVSAKVLVFNPASDQPLAVELPDAAVNLTGAAGGDFSVLVAGTPPRMMTLDAQTGEVREPGATPAPAGAPATGAFVPRIDLGDGLTNVLASASVAQGLFAVIVADDADQPTKAKIAVVNRQNEVQVSHDFPENWVPLVAPRAADRPGAAAPARRVTFSFDTQKKIFYTLARRIDNSRHGLVTFSGEDPSPGVLSFPDSWFAAACTSTIPFFHLELSRKLVLLASNAAETEWRDPCPGAGFVLLDLETQNLTAVPLPGQGEFDADLGASGDVNDFIYGSNTDPSRRNTADTLFVLDGVTASAFRLDLPPGTTSFANLVAVPQMNALIGMAANRAPGDAGFIFFDLERAEARVLPTPEGFSIVNFLAVFPATRKLAARGIKAGGAGSQYLIYDLVTGDLFMPPNPEGVVSVGTPVVQPGQGGGAAGGTRPGQPGGTSPGQAAPGAAPAVLQHANPKANTIAAIGYNAEGKQAGILVVRVP